MITVRLFRAFLICLAYPSLCVNGFTQVKAKQKVHFVCTCTDSIGARYATALRDLLATSPRYQSAAEFTEGKGESAVWNLGLHVVSLDPTKLKTGESSVLSVTITIGPLYVTNVIQSCLNEKVCAADTLASLDEEAAE